MPTKTRMPTEAELEAAYRRREERLRTEPLAIDVRYDRVGDTVVIEMNNGAALIIPRRLMQGLSDATTEQLQRGAIAESGTCLEWRDVDADFEVISLLQGVYGGRRWMSELARQAGSKTSPAKTAAARRNGAKGGRPRKASA
ncbi:MAG: DUF2442 domain-containing protein [Candidatus Lustribacter sp.]